MTHTAPTALDLAAGISPGTSLFAARRERPDFVSGAEECRRTVLYPKDGLGLAPDLRLAVALRIARAGADRDLAAGYEAERVGLAPDAMLDRFAAGATADLPVPLAVLAAHVDMVTLGPQAAGPGYIARLTAAGFDTPQIVALSELIAFVNFELRIAAGLRLLKG